MKPKTQPKTPNQDLFRPLLVDIINPQHELARLEGLIDWAFFEQEWAGYFPSTTGRPATSPRLIAGLFYLQHLYGHSDEGVLSAFLQSPYYQHFCGCVHFEHELPIDPSSLVRWRKRVGEEGLEWLLTQSIQAAVNAKMVSPKSFEQIIVDTTVMEKAITHPTDSKLLETARQRLVKQAQSHGINLRQNYNKVAPRQAIQTGRYAHAKQFKRMRQSLKKQRTYLGRIVRDVERKVQQMSDALKHELSLAKRLLSQKPKDKNKLYSLHAPEVECIGKGKSRKPYEFGVKVTIATTLKEGLVVGMRSLPGNPYDGHTLAEALAQKEIRTSTPTKLVCVDKGYKGHGIETSQVLISGQKRGMTASLKKKLKRRSAIEPTIGHMKTEGRLDRCTLKGELGDAMFALLCGAGHNLRLLLNFLRDFLLFLWIATWKNGWRNEHSLTQNHEMKVA
jgi:IS5 family transposase